MKLLVGRFVLGCIWAVLVVANIAPETPTESPPSVTTPKVSSPVHNITEKLIASSPVSTQEIIKLPENPPTPEKNSKIFGLPNIKENNERELVVIQSGGGGHHDHGYHDHHGYREHEEHDYYHPPPMHPPAHHNYDHHHPPPHHHHYPPPYPGYYPPHYPPYYHRMAQPYGAGAGGVAIPPPPPYPYYPPSIYYNSPPMKPSATILQTSSTSSSIGQNYPKPSDLLNQGTEYLWNLFGKIGAVTGGNHEVVLINSKPAPSANSVQLLPSNLYSTKGKIISNIDCINKNEHN